MFTPYDPNLTDLDFELVDNLQQHQILNEPMVKDWVSPASPSSNYRIIKSINTNKRSGAVQLRKQLTDDSINKQCTPPNSTGTSLSPMSSSYLSRFSSSNDNSPIRTLNTIYLSSPVTNTANSSNNNALSTSAKQVEAVTLLLKQTIAPAQLIQSVPTRLENPTKYHLEQICRRQSLVTNESPSTQTTAPLQPTQPEESSPDSEVTSEMDDQFNDDITCGSIDNASLGINIIPRLSTTVTGDRMSSILSSSTPKGSTDSIDRHSSSCPTNILSAKARIGLPLTEDEMRLVIRDRQKKDNHNMIERRRRFNINDRIKELGTLLPKGTDLDVKQNKGTILRASVDYIKFLRRQYDNISLIEDRCRMFSQQNSTLQNRVRELEEKCLLNGISVNLLKKGSPIIATTSPNIIKQEPSSLNDPTNPLVSPSSPIFATLDTFSPLNSLSTFGTVDDDSNEKKNLSGNKKNNNSSGDSLSTLAHDPFLSSISFGFDSEMDIEGVFP